jgi:hypothetical protein
VWLGFFGAAPESEEVSEAAADLDYSQEAEKVRAWRYEQLRLLGYNHPQRQRLVERIELNELQLEQVRRLAKLGASVEQAWWVLS